MTLYYNEKKDQIKQSRQLTNITNQEVKMYHLYSTAASQPASSSRNKAESDFPIKSKNSTRILQTSNTAQNSSIGMEDVRIHYSFAPSEQLKTSQRGVIQLAEHIHNLRELDETEIPVIPSVKPTMVFESMGTSDTAMENVYKETKKYKGNTVCVFGLNKKQDGGQALVKARDLNEIPHHLVNFTFEWSKPDRMVAAKGYEMPFVEARLAIMKQANRLIFNTCNSEEVTPEQQNKVITPTEENLDFSMDPVYRWIDGDARDDSSDDLEIDFLREFSQNQNSNIVTGAYEWRHESDETARRAPTYHAFFALLNEKEALLRKTYMDRMREEAYTGTRMGNAYSSGDFYLPESTFLMNRRAHDILSRGPRGINLDGDQARESMRLFNASSMGKGVICYDENLHVTKPLKREFDENDGYAHSLIHFFSQDRYRKDMLKPALEEIRQSAFGTQWMPKGDAACERYGSIKEGCIEAIHVFLDAEDRFKTIKREISTLRGLNARKKKR